MIDFLLKLNLPMQAEDILQRLAKRQRHEPDAHLR